MTLPERFIKTYPLRSRRTVSCRLRPYSTGIRPFVDVYWANVFRVRRLGERVARQQGCRSASLRCGSWLLNRLRPLPTRCAGSGSGDVRPGGDVSGQAKLDRFDFSVQADRAFEMKARCSMFRFQIDTHLYFCRPALYTHL